VGGGGLHCRVKATKKTIETRLLVLNKMIEPENQWGLAKVFKMQQYLFQVDTCRAFVVVANPRWVTPPK
jgi:hypothetical protein